jgi:excisionase family DNA binding protein
MSDLPLILDTEEVAEALRISQQRVRELVASGALRRLRYTRVILVHRDELLRFLAEQTGGES